MYFPQKNEQITFLISNFLQLPSMIIFFLSIMHAMIQFIY